MKKGYTISEFCIVAVILLIISIVIVPQFGKASVQARSSHVGVVLDDLNQQVKLYARDHNGSMPGMKKFDIVKALTCQTDQFGSPYTAEAESMNLKKCGPYIYQIPSNPFNDKNTIRLNGRAAGANTHGWRFDTLKGVFESDSPTHHLE